MKIKFQFNVSLQKDAEEKKNTVTVNNSSFVDCARKEILNARERGSFSTAANYDTALRSLLTFIKREDIMLNEITTEMLESYTDEKLTSIGFGDYSTKLVSDYSKKDPSSRSKTMNTIVDGYKSASEKISTVFADGANSYVLPYVTNVSNVPVYSSGFNVTDFDIPFYQMVIHGYVDYASTPINKSSNSDETFLLSLASGSQIHYDMTYADADTLQDTEYDDLYYSNYAGWTDLAANQYKKVSSILSGVSDYTITKYELSDDKNVLTTTYSKDGASDVVISVDKKNATATVGTEVYDLADCIEGGLTE